MDSKEFKELQELTRRKRLLKDAAPDMLRALESCARILRLLDAEHYPAYKEVTTAIAKAKGFACI